MKYPQELVRARFVRREKRFFIHALLDDGSPVIAHTNNTGRMSGCLAPDAVIWLSPADNPARKLKWTLELVETQEDVAMGIPGGVLVGVNTAMANRLVQEALTDQVIDNLSGYPNIRAEAPYGSRRSRIDFLLRGHVSRPDCWVEVKNSTLVNHGHARFPDAPSERGRKHLLELEEILEQGQRAALVFCLQREDAESVGPADDIDPEYGQILRKVTDRGLEVFGARCTMSTSEVKISTLVPLEWARF